MKKIIASAGLLAVGAVGLQAADSYGLTSQEASKPWSVSAALRGFYDDNYATRHQKTGLDSFGIEAVPRVSLNLPLEQTLIKLSYQYTMKYYFDRAGDDFDHTHEFDAIVDHHFSDRYRLKLDESFVYSQEPELLDAGTPLRSDSDAIRNRAKLDFTAQITELVSTEVGYANYYYDYFQEAGDVQNPVTNPNGGGSRSALLDRVLHAFHVDGLYEVRENSTALVGYQYMISDYTSSDPLAAGAVNDLTILKGTDRDNTSHFFYVGGRHAFSPALQASVKVGAQYVDFENVDESSWAPYADLMGSYSYLPGSYLQIGARVMRTATDIAGTGRAIGLTTDQESVNAYVSVNHKITPMLTGNFFGQYQYSKMQNGVYDGQSEDFFMLGLGLDYKINNWWAIEGRYGFDALVSDLNNNGAYLDRGFTRNRVSLGVRATY